MSFPNMVSTDSLSVPDISCSPPPTLVYACGTCPLALLCLPQSANFSDIEVFLLLFWKTEQTRIFPETTLEDINFHFRAFCNNSLYNWEENRLYNRRIKSSSLGGGSLREPQITLFLDYVMHKCII